MKKKIARLVAFLHSYFEPRTSNFIVVALFLIALPLHA